MNPKVQELLDKKIAEKKEEELKRRNEHLISLGLVDTDNIEKIYVKTQIIGSKIDNENNQFYIEKYNAIEVTDEEYKEICKYYPETTNSNYQKINNNYSESVQIKYDTPNIQENNGTILQLKEDVSSIKSWVKFWSIFSIVIMAIAIIVLIANR